MFKTKQFLKKHLIILLILLLSAGYIVSKEVDNQPVVKVDNKKAEQPDSNLKYYNAGLIALENNNLTAAIENFKKSIAENPEFTDAYDNLGLAFRLSGDTHSALKTYKISLQKNPDDPKTLLLIANLYLIMKDQSSGLAILKKLNRVDPDNPEILFTLGNIYSSMGRYTIARAFYLRAFDSYPDDKPVLKSHALLNVGFIYFHRRQYDIASDFFRRALKFDDKNNSTYYYLALSSLLSSTPDITTAQESINKALLLGFPVSEEVLSFFNISEPGKK